ncbi:MAG: 2,3-bisphosphoglycerate-independent phosphoglycerate mutase [Abditibacteriota bacterium]|nr:2,3-bisphosphoglycerate-independent phosphoglycerate mutase [Abditibacteriota bacterium]
MAKGILLVADGLGDRPIESLGGKTPLEVAKIPNIDKLAAEGENGLLDTIGVGVRAGSDTAHISLLGYDPYKYYTGRGPFEAAGIGMDVIEGDVAFRCNFSTVDENMVILDRRAGRITTGTDQLAKAMAGLKCDDMEIIFKESVAHRGALIIRGKNLGANITDTDPHHEKAKVLVCKPIDPNDEASARTAKAVNFFVQKSYEILKDHPVNLERIEKGLNPANVILPRGGGVGPSMENFEKKYGIKGACVSETGLINGVAKYVGMTIVDTPEATGGYDTNCIAMAKNIIKALEDHDFVLSNVKAADVAGHDNNPNGKIDMLRKIDAMIKYLMENVSKDTYIIFTADHSTPCELMDHSGDPVAVCIWGKDVRVDDVKEFTERACAKGGLCRINGQNLLPILTNLMFVQDKFGA